MTNLSSISFIKTYLGQAGEYLERAYAATGSLADRLSAYWMQISTYRQIIRRCFSATAQPANDTIPPEILIYIFSFITDGKTLRNIRLVCKNWHAASEDECTTMRRIALTILESHGQIIPPSPQGEPSEYSAEALSLSMKYTLTKHTEREVKEFIHHYISSTLQTIPNSDPTSQERAFAERKLIELILRYNAAFHPKEFMLPPAGLGYDPSRIEALIRLGYLATSPHTDSKNQLEDRYMDQFLSSCDSKPMRLALVATAAYIGGYKRGEQLAMNHLRSLNPPQGAFKMGYFDTLSLSDNIRIAKYIAVIDLDFAKQIISAAKQDGSQSAIMFPELQLQSILSSEAAKSERLKKGCSWLSWIYSAPIFPQQEYAELLLDAAAELSDRQRFANEFIDDLMMWW